MPGWQTAPGTQPYSSTTSGCLPKLGGQLVSGSCVLLFSIGQEKRKISRAGWNCCVGRARAHVFDPLGHRLPQKMTSRISSGGKGGNKAIHIHWGDWERKRLKRLEQGRGHGWERRHLEHKSATGRVGGFVCSLKSFTRVDNGMRWSPRLGRDG